MNADTFWNKFNSPNVISYNDIEKYLYTDEYIALNSPQEYADFKGSVFNENLNVYFFQTKKFKDLDDDVFFQNHLDGNILEDEYKAYEDKAIQMCMEMFSRSETYAFYNCLTGSFENNSPAQKSIDVLTQVKMLESNLEKTIIIDDKNFYVNLCYVGLREIGIVHFIYPKLKAVMVITGFHGYIASENPLDDDLLNALSKHVYIEN